MLDVPRDVILYSKDELDHLIKESLEQNMTLVKEPREVLQDDQTMAIHTTIDSIPEELIDLNTDQLKTLKSQFLTKSKMRNYEYSKNKSLTEAAQYKYTVVKLLLEAKEKYGH